MQDTRDFIYSQWNNPSVGIGHHTAGNLLKAGAFGWLGRKTWKAVNRRNKQKRVDASAREAMMRGKRMRPAGFDDAPVAVRARYSSRRRVLVPRRRFRSRRSFKKGRFSRRRTRRSKGSYRSSWKMDDVFRTTYVYRFNNSVTDKTTSEALTNRKAITWFCPNFVYLADALGAHGLYDLKTLYTTAGDGVALTTDNVARSFRFQGDNNRKRFKVRGSRLTVRFTPDWQVQGAATGDVGGTTPTFSDVTKMVVHAYVFTCRQKTSRATIVGTPAGTNPQASIATPTDNGIRQLISQWSIEPVDATTIDDNNTVDGGGWLYEYARGLSRRIGTNTPFATSSTLINNAFNVIPIDSNVWTSASLCANGVGYYDSPQLTSVFKIRKTTMVIPAGESRNMTVRLPSYTVDPAKLDLTLPPSVTSMNETEEVPAGYSFVVFDTQVMSNKTSSTNHVPVRFNAEVNYSTRMCVPWSTAGGNLYIDNIGQNTADAAGIQLRANPLRAPVDFAP